jgi:hypothetical protein
MKIDESITNELIHNWKKPNVDPLARAKFIRDWIKENKITIVEFREKFNIPKGTLTGWLCYSKITDKEYSYLTMDKGVNKKLIYDCLKCNRESNEEIVNIIEKKSSYEQEFIDYLEKTISNFKEYLLNPPKIDNGMLMHLSELQQILRKLEKKLR